MVNRYLLDTNAVIALLQGNTKLLKILNNAEWIGISVLSQLEFLSFSNLTQKDKECFAQFLKRIEVVGLDTYQIELVDTIVRLRQQYRLKLPDAVIAGTTICFEAMLVTSDKQLMKNRRINLFQFYLKGVKTDVYVQIFKSSSFVSPCVDNCLNHES